MTPKIAIIGGNGFIGKNFSEFFSEKGYEIISIDRDLDEAIKKSNITSLVIDIHHTKELIRALSSVQCLIWLVHASVPSTEDDSLIDDFNLNINPIIKFLEKAKSLTSLKKFIYLSSGGTIYGNIANHLPISESHSHKPISNYGLSKSVTERYIEFITQASNYESVIVRPSNVYGKYQNLVKPQGIIGYAFKAIRDEMYLDLYDNGRVVRDFICVTDLSKAIEMIILSKVKIGETKFYNLGSNKGYSIKEILGKVEKVSGKNLKINPKTSRTFDCEYNVLDTSRIASEMGWAIETNIDEGLEVVWNWINLKRTGI